MWPCKSLAVLLAIIKAVISAPSLPDYVDICRPWNGTATKCQCTPQLDTLTLSESTSHSIFVDAVSIKSLVISGCREVDLESKPRQTDRIALENSTQVRVHGIQVSEGRNTDLIVQDVESLVLSGDVTCIDCNQASTTEVKYETDGVIPLEVPGPRVKMQLPLLQVQVLGVKNFTVHDFSTGRGGQEVVDFRMKVDNVDRMSARDVYFNHLRPSAVDVSRTPDVTIAQGEFHNASFGSLKFDGGCENIVIKDSLLPKSSLMLLNSNRTSVSFSCTASPDRLATDLLKMMSQEDAETDCSGAISRWLGTSSLTAAAETECGAAVALAVVSTIILLIVVAVLLYMDRTGRLDNYL